MIYINDNLRNYFIETASARDVKKFCEDNKYCLEISNGWIKFVKEKE